MINLKNSTTLTIRMEDLNVSFKKPDLIRKLKKLTIRPTSGMNHELNNLLRVSASRPVDCKILIAYQNRKIVAWSLLSKEATNFEFSNSEGGFKSQFGLLFQIYVDPLHRRKGIASALLRKAQRLTNGQRICICPHDMKSENFYNKFKNLNTKIL